MNVEVSALVAKALADCGYDLLSSAEDGWIAAAISGNTGRVLVRGADEGVLLAVPEPTMADRIGLEETAVRVPQGMADIGVAYDAIQLYEALRILHSLQTHPAFALSARVETRLAGIPATERTREVRQRIGQDVFREALMDLWQGRCAVTGIPLPRQLLRASHAKPWALASDRERLDPFNGLLLAVHLDAMFDSGLMAVSSRGELQFARTVNDQVLRMYGLNAEIRVSRVLPGHMPYLAWHHSNVFQSG